MICLKINLFLRYGFFWMENAFKYHASSLCWGHFHHLDKNVSIHPKEWFKIKIAVLIS